MWLLSKLQKTSNSTRASMTKCEDGHEWWASFEFYPLSVGSRKSVFDGRMYIPENFWSQKEAVVKAVNIGQGTEEDLKTETRAAIVAEEFAREFNKLYGCSERLLIKFNRPLVAVLESTSIFNGPFRLMKGYNKVLVEGEVVTIEEVIEGEFINFIRKNGVISNTCDSILQAFCHFTYNASGGNLVICGLQGSKKNSVFKLSTPTIHSRNRDFGKCDGGEAGIQTFFSHHQCNEICKNMPVYGYEIKASAPELDTKIGEVLSKSFAYEKISDPEITPKQNDLCNLISVDIHPPAYDGHVSPPPYHLAHQSDCRTELEIGKLKQTLPGVHQS